MSNIFKSFKNNITSTFTTVYTVPSNATAIILSVYLTDASINKNNMLSIKVNGFYVYGYIGLASPIGGAAGKVVLNALDTVEMSHSSATASLHGTLSILEITE